MPKYALIIDGIVDTTTTGASAPEGWAAIPEDVFGGFSADGEGGWLPPEEVPVVVVSHLNNDGLVRFAAVAPIAVRENIRIGTVTRLVKGRYRVFLEQPMVSDSYSVFASVMDAAVRTVRVTARTISYFEIRCTDTAGLAADAEEITINIKRVVN